MFIKKFLLVVVIGALILSGCSILKEKKSGVKGQNSDIPQDFDFVLKYGVTARNELNTFEGTFTKDLIAVGTATTKLKLSADEKRKIYEEMMKVKILEYPAVFKPKSNRGVEPHLTYYLKVRMNGKIKEITWEDESEAQTREAVRLRDLINKIIDLIKNKNEFKKLPAPQGGYA